MSVKGLRGILKSPPSIKRPELKPSKSFTSFLQKDRWDVLGRYTFARVVGTPYQVPFMKMYLPSVSTSLSVISKEASLLSRMETPFDLDVSLVAW